MTYQASSRSTPDTHQRNADKLSRIPVKVDTTAATLRKPEWIRVKIGDSEKINQIKKALRKQDLHTVCEEAACPNLAECFQMGTATFMIMGDLCTRRCPFCDVAHGKPKPLDAEEPQHLAETILQLGLNYAVITSVNRDDLRDGGAGHFAACIRQIRALSPRTRIEILVPDFRGRLERAIEILAGQPCDIFNHNLETIPRLYKQARPGADYQVSLELLKKYREAVPGSQTKSGLMLGIGETASELSQVMEDLLEHGCTMLTLGQYLQPSRDHLPVQRYLHPDEFAAFADQAKQLGFVRVTSGPLVRSSYHADTQADSI